MKAFKYKAEDNKVYVTHYLSHKSPTKHLLCTVDKSHQTAWADYIANRMNLVEELMASGLTHDEIKALGRMAFDHYKPDKEKITN